MRHILILLAMLSGAACAHHPTYEPYDPPKAELPTEPPKQAATPQDLAAPAEPQAEQVLKLTQDLAARDEEIAKLRKENEALTAKVSFAALDAFGAKIDGKREMYRVLRDVVYEQCVQYGCNGLKLPSYETLEFIAPALQGVSND